MANRRFGWRSGVVHSRDALIGGTTGSQKRVTLEPCISVGVAALTATNLTEVPVFIAPFDCTISQVGVSFDSAVTGAATNNFGVRFKDKGSAGSGTDIMATRTYASGTNATAFNLEDLGTVSFANLSTGDVISFEKFENGTGLNMPNVIAYVRFERRTEQA